MKTLRHTLLINFFFLIVTSPTFGQGPESYWKQIKSLENDKQYTNALVLVERLIYAEPNNLLLQRKRAHLNDARGNRSLAIVQMRELLAKEPNNDTVLNSLGILYEFSGMLDSALNCFNAFLKIAKNKADSFDANLNLGSVYNFQQRYERAISHFEAMKKQYPDSLGVLANLAQAYADNGQKEKGAEIMRLIIKKNPHDAGAYGNLGMLYTQMNKLQDAKTIFEIGVKQTPDDPLLLNNYGFLLCRMKEYNKAILFINKSISIAPTNPYAYRNRALVYIDLKLMKEACLDLNASRELGFKTYYGGEVDALIASHCK